MPRRSIHRAVSLYVLMLLLLAVAAHFFGIYDKEFEKSFPIAQVDREVAPHMSVSLSIKDFISAAHETLLNAYPQREWLTGYVMCCFEIGVACSAIGGKQHKAHIWMYEHDKKLIGMPCNGVTCLPPSLYSRVDSLRIINNASRPLYVSLEFSTRAIVFKRPYAPLAATLAGAAFLCGGVATADVYMWKKRRSMSVSV
ncbi:MAG: hypothetical protein J7L98_02075 [Candidatus Verstraetearchaeota archaeon]|nr:hypothetical protein [Candidatus Verstraetearchaeota archaeon]